MNRERGVLLDKICTWVSDWRPAVRNITEMNASELFSPLVEFDVFVFVECGGGTKVRVTTV